MFFLGSVDKTTFTVQFNNAASALQELIFQQHSLVCEEMEKLQQMKEQHMKEIDTARRELDADIAQFEEMKKKLEAMYHDHNDVVDLNVGGQKFSTLRSTLTKYSGSMLDAMFSGRHPMTKDKKGNYFIDRNPDIFRLVLEYLRIDNFPFFQSPNERVAFFRELDYFGLPKSIHLTYSHVMDNNGVFYYLGTSCSTEPWRNPSALGLVKICASTKAGADLNLLTSRSLDHSIENSYDNDRDPWITIFLRDYKLIPKYYMIHQDKEGDHLLRNWTFEVSQTGSTWNQIKTHINDTTITCPASLSGAWPLECQEPYQHFRIHFGNSHKNTKNYSLSQLELYGTLIPLTLN